MVPLLLITALLLLHGTVVAMYDTVTSHGGTVVALFGTVTTRCGTVVALFGAVTTFCYIAAGKSEPRARVTIILVIEYSCCVSTVTVYANTHE